MKSVKFNILCGTALTAIAFAVPAHAQVTIGGDEVEVNDGAPDAINNGGIIDTNGADITTEDGYLNTGGGNIYTQGGGVVTGGGNFNTNTGNINTTGGHIASDGGYISTVGGELRTDGGDLDINGGNVVDATSVSGLGNISIQSNDLGTASSISVTDTEITLHGGTTSTDVVIDDNGVTVSDSTNG